MATVSLNSVFDMIKYGSDKKCLIEEAQRALILNFDKDKYDSIKVTLPCVTYSFLFNGYRNSKSIIKPTGIIAIDMDGDTKCPDEDILYASYKTLSNKGRHCLVKVEGLTQNNFRYNYELISEKLGINADLNAAKVTQPFIIPFDSSIYINNDSEIWKANEIKKTHIIPEKKEKVIGNGVGQSEKKRFTNLNDIIAHIDFDGEAIYDNGEKFGVASIFIPRHGIREGYRNTILIAIGYQFRALNPTSSYYDIYNLLQDINKKHSKPPVTKKELKKLVNSIMKTESDDLKLTLNERKRFVFNPDYDLTRKERQSLVMTAINKDKARKSFEEIRAALDEWEFLKHGKITQKKLAMVAGKNIKTIKKYYSKFKDKIKSLNKSYKEKTKPP
ncbi:hypothetical protein [Christiangramia flava]|nr:hypothetical protein [Christiangramia flava]